VDVRVAGHQVDTGESLQEHAATRIAQITEKYFSRSVGANVTFGRGPNNDFTCDIVAPVVNGVVLKASYSAREPQMAFNGAVDDAETQPFVENAGYTIFSGPRQDGDERSDFPAIVAETRVDIPESSVSDAVMLMDLRNTTALMFKNSATGEFNMIYRREDGNIGWVEPHTN
jgi:ribosomal subunit interface protein